MAKGKKTGGRQKGSKNFVNVDVRYLAQTYAEKALQTLYDLMTSSKQDVVRKAAATEILDRAYGKPSPMEAPKDTEAATPVNVTVEVVDARKPDA
jgi:hypothetical protein